MNEDKKIFEELQAGTKDLEWLSNQFSVLKKKYPKKFVAIKNQQVILAETSLDTLIQKLKKRFGNANDFLIDFVPDDKYVLVV